MVRAEYAVSLTTKGADKQERLSYVADDPPETHRIPIIAEALSAESAKFPTSIAIAQHESQDSSISKSRRNDLLPKLMSRVSPRTIPLQRF